MVKRKRAGTVKLFILVVIISVFSILFSLNNASTYASDGKELFINKCGQCHGQGKESKVFAPTKYAAAIWERFFSRNKHERKKDIRPYFTDSELRSIKQYLKEHAADSDQPEAIGLR